MQFFTEAKSENMTQKTNWISSAEKNVLRNRRYRDTNIMCCCDALCNVWDLCFFFFLSFLSLFPKLGELDVARKPKRERLFRYSYFLWLYFICILANTFIKNTNIMTYCGVFAVHGTFNLNSRGLLRIRLILVLCDWEIKEIWEGRICKSCHSACKHSKH